MHLNLCLPLAGLLLLSNHCFAKDTTVGQVYQLKACTPEEKNDLSEVYAIARNSTTEGGFALGNLLNGYTNALTYAGAVKAFEAHIGPSALDLGNLRTAEEVCEQTLDFEPFVL